MFLSHVRQVRRNQKTRHVLGWRKSIVPIIDDNNFRWDSGVVLDVSEVQTFVDTFGAEVSEQLGELSL